MKTAFAGLQNSVSTTYASNLTYLAGRCFQKTINGQLVVGPPLSNFIDTFTDMALTPAMGYLTGNGRLFVCQAIAGGQMTIGLYTFDFTGVIAPAAIGKIIVNVPNQAATTHTLRHLKVYDGAVGTPITTGIKIVFGTTGTVAINGGEFLVNSVAIADFSLVTPPTIGMAIATNTKSVYSLQETGLLGSANVLTAITGGITDPTNQIIGYHNGTAASSFFGEWDLTQTPAVAGTQTVTPPASGSTGWTTSSAHGFVVGDQIALTSTGVLGTPWVVSTATVMTVYFIQSVGSSTTFTLSATSGGAVQTATANSTGTTTVMRGYGQSSSLYKSSVRTGNITGLAGVLLANNSENLTIPTESNIPVALQGNQCWFFATTTNFYLFKTSDLAAGITSIPSLATINASGNGGDVTAITVANAVYSSDVNQAIYTSNSSQFYAKKWVNNQLANIFGGLNTTWLETVRPMTATFAAVAVGELFQGSGGWLLFTSSTAGQRGIFFADARSDNSYGFSYITSPVLSLGAVQTMKVIDTLEQLFDVTDTVEFYYRTGTSSGDANFATATSGSWVQIHTAADLSAMAITPFIQFKCGFDITTTLAATPAQLQDLVLTYLGANEISSNWEGSMDNTTVGAASPSYTAFRMTTAYAATVPQLFFRAYDDSGNLYIQKDTVNNPTFFQYSTNNGTSWNSLGTIPNTPLTTEVRYAWATPPGIKVTCSLRES